MVVAGQAAAALHRPVGHEELDAALEGLDGAAGLEVWRLTADLAAATGVERWWRAAEERLDRLASDPATGPELRRWATDYFDRLRSGRSAR
jgi:hypothetical protein